MKLIKAIILLIVSAITAAATLGMLLSLLQGSFDGNPISGVFIITVTGYAAVRSFRVSMRVFTILNED